MKSVYTADWQLSDAFGRLDSDARAALTEARFDAIDTVSAGSDPWILDAPLVWSDDALLDLMVEADERMKGIFLTCRDRAFRHVPANRLSLTEASA